MYFRVNGVPIFLKGANLIPFHVVRTKATDDLMMASLKAAVGGAGFKFVRGCVCVCVCGEG